MHTLSVVEDVQPLRSRTGRLTLLFLLFVAIAVAIGTVFASERSTEASIGGPMEGQIAPEIVATAFDGETWRLSEHLADDGRPVLLNLWASWCEPCREEIPELSAFAEAHPEIMVVGVAVRDVAADAESVAAELSPSYLMGLDDTERLRDSYVGFGMPSTFLIDRQGRIEIQMEGAVTVDLLEDLIPG